MTDYSDASGFGTSIGLWLTSFAFVSQAGTGRTFWYVMDDVGQLKKAGAGYLADGSNAIAAWWRSKRLDFSDQYPEDAGLWKGIDKCELVYRDLYADTPVAIYISTDGGVNWTYKLKVLGTGDGKTKSAWYYFLDVGGIHGHMFNFKIESVSATTNFEWSTLRIWYTPGGEAFEIA